jgi:hypothetical protein
MKLRNGTAAMRLIVQDATRGVVQMRKAILAMAAVAALATPALAAQRVTVYGDYNPAAPAEVTTGAVTGAVVGVGVSEGWWGSTIGGAALPTTAAGAAAVGGVAGVGTAVAIDAAIQPCRGFQALFGLNQPQCAQRQAALDAQYVGTHQRRVVRR